MMVVDCLRRLLPVIGALNLKSAFINICDYINYIITKTCKVINSLKMEGSYDYYQQY
jgi:hypothetical protein